MLGQALAVVVAGVSLLTELSLLEKI